MSRCVGHWTEDETNWTKLDGYKSMKTAAIFNGIRGLKKVRCDGGWNSALNTQTVDTNFDNLLLLCKTAVGFYFLSLSLSLSPTVCLHFNGHFPGEPGLAGVQWSKGWWRWWWQLDCWSYKSCKAPVKSPSPANQHQVFYRPDALPVAQPTVSKHWREVCGILLE